MSNGCQLKIALVSLAITVPVEVCRQWTPFNSSLSVLDAMMPRTSCNNGKKSRSLASPIAHKDLVHSKAQFISSVGRNASSPRLRLKAQPRRRLYASMMHHKTDHFGFKC